MMGYDNRILKPSEYDAIREQPEKYKNKFILDLFLNTGMRYAELKRFVANVNDKNSGFKWFRPEEEMIILPKQATKTKIQREVILTPAFTEKLKDEIERNDGQLYPLPAYQVLDENLKRWARKAGIEMPEIIAVKTFRKTWESWLVYANKNIFYILSSQGHSNAVALKHYVKKITKWDEKEKKEIIKRTQGWGE